MIFDAGSLLANCILLDFSIVCCRIYWPLSIDTGCFCKPRLGSQSHVYFLYSQILSNVEKIFFDLCPAYLYQTQEGSGEERHISLNLHFVPNLEQWIYYHLWRWTCETYSLFIFCIRRDNGKPLFLKSCIKSSIYPL